jgi:hypothetical protein
MFGKIAKEHIELIVRTAAELWGNKCVFGEMKVSPAPWSEFEWSMRLYDKVDAVLFYDRSIIGIHIIIEGEEKFLRKLFPEEVIVGFESSEPENLLHNFQVLDRIALEIILNGKT